MAFTSLNHYLDLEWLKYAYDQTRKDGAVGVDGQAASEYASNLMENLQCLLGKLKSGGYHAPPVRRVQIPKADGTKRALGIPTFEDKVAQRAIVMLLEPIYEGDFLACSFGSRPGRSAHQALTRLRNRIMDRGGRWILDVDVSRYFDSIDHRHLRKFLGQRVVDGVIRRLLDKWLKAGVLEGQEWMRSRLGTPQGGVISPLLANVYLHCVLDEWFVSEIVPRMKSRCALVRYCDDFVMVFEDFLDCVRVRRVLGKRLGKYGLELHPDKTCMVDFRFRRPGKVRHAATQATTFSFLGFRHCWGKSRQGKNVVYQWTSKDRLARALSAMWSWCRNNRHAPVGWQARVLTRKMLGHYAYFGITGNSKRLRWYAYQIPRIWRYWLSRRTRGNPIRWDAFHRLLSKHPLPRPHVVHRYAARTSESVL